MQGGGEEDDEVVETETEPLQVENRWEWERIICEKEVNQVINCLIP